MVRALGAALLICAALSGCMSATQTPPPADALLAQADAAVERGDYTAAVLLLGDRAGTDSRAGTHLAAVRLAWGRALAAARPGDPTALRDALDQFSLGLSVAPSDQDLEAHQQAALALIALSHLQAALATAPAEEHPRLHAALAAQADSAAALWPQLPGAAELIGAARAAAVPTAAVSAATAPVAAAPARSRPAPAQAAPARPAPAQAAPAPRPRPAKPASGTFSVAQRKSFDGSANSGHYASCIDVQIIGRGGPISGAVVGINNGEHSYQNQTDGSGYTGRCGLGASTWSVVLFWVPPDRSIAGAATTVYLSGAPEQRAAVVFQER